MQNLIDILFLLACRLADSESGTAYTVEARPGRGDSWD